MAILFIDMDKFKSINDTFGHDAGDALLISIADRMQEVVGDRGMCCRLGGDEFIVIMDKYRRKGEIEEVGAKLLAALQPPFTVTVEGRDLPLDSTPSIGIALFPQHGATPEELIKSADLAMYGVKQNGKNNYRFAP